MFNIPMNEEQRSQLGNLVQKHQEQKARANRSTCAQVETEVKFVVFELVADVKFTRLSYLTYIFPHVVYIGYHGQVYVRVPTQSVFLRNLRTGLGQNEQPLNRCFLRQIWCHSFTTTKKSRFHPTLVRKDPIRVMSHVRCSFSIL